MSPFKNQPHSPDPSDTIDQLDTMRLDLLHITRSENTGRLLLRAYRTVSECGTAELRRRGHGEITISHAIVLPYIDLAGTRLSVLAERVGVTKQSMTQLVQELERHGYLARQTDPNDKRVQVMTITEWGWQLLHDLRQMKQLMEDSIDRLLGVTNAETLRALLASLASDYTGYEDC